MSSAERQQALRDRRKAGLVILTRIIPLDIKPEADALIDRLIAEWDKRKGE